MELEQGDIVFLSGIDPEMTDQAFEALLVGKSQNTTVPTMRKAKALITRGLLTRGTERKGISDEKEIIAGTYRQRDASTICRIFLVENNDKTTLIWQGDPGQFRSNYMRIRDDLAGMVPYRLYGKAANKAHENHMIVRQVSHEVPKKTTNKAAEKKETPAISRNPQDSSNPLPRESASILCDMPSWVQELRKCRRCFESDEPCVFIDTEGVAPALL